MKWSELFDKWSLSGLKAKAGFIEMDFMPNDVDKNAAWEMYVEMQTRITTQELGDEEGDEVTALQSIYTLFQLTRDLLKKYGRHAPDFSRIALFIINEEVRPFTGKWHKLSADGKLNDAEQRKMFRKELKDLQVILGAYSSILEDMAGVKGLSIQKK
ncbi:hypothetical protein [Sulfurovum sp. NBC37-1]|uniref:hypothetical protein n=1 Tax=Sulfurovum sp. (strain NBC37-1) TaxID=387093 RepID=UPI0001587B41|nr:hypothetical protein [Sulfurovum sp. NBC37-1]BAF73053.1 conserved hypothetical protein [Sulfurovum sp. NBC37-1]